MGFDFTFNLELFLVFVFLYFFILYVYLRIKRRIVDKRLINSVTSLDRGTDSERGLILDLLKRGFPAKSVFHDLYVRKNDGKFSQIDLVIATKEGIIVLEVKEYSGWIFGRANQTNWTQMLAYGKRKYRFYNPIKQNINHIKALKAKLKLFDNIPFFSVIVFFGNCEFKKIDYVPRDTYIVKAHRIFEALDKIANENNPAPYLNKREIVNVLKEAVDLGNNIEVINRHKNDIEDMLGTNRILK